MRGLPRCGCARAAAWPYRAEPGLIILCAPEAAEDLAADRVIPVAEGAADGAGPSSPRATAEHLVLGTEEHLGVLGIGECLEPGPRSEVTRGPLPHVADHAGAAERRDVTRVGAQRRGAEPELVQVGQLAARGLLAPG